MNRIFFILVTCFLLIQPHNILANQDQSDQSKPINQSQSDIESLKDEMNSNFEDMKELINDKRLNTLQQEMREQYEKLDQKIQKLEQKLIPSQQNQPNTVSEQSSENLGKWWWKNSLTFDPMPKQWLYHFDLTYSWVRLKGNAVADDHDLQVRFVFRKNRITNYFKYKLDKKNRALGDDGVSVVNLMTGATDEFIEVNKNVRDTISHHAFYEGRFDIIKEFYVSIGGIYDEDDFLSIKQRMVGFFGLGGIPFQTDTFSLDFYCGVGKEEKEYIKKYHDYAELLQPYPHLYYLLPNYKSGPIRSDIVYINEKINWAITEHIVLQEDFYYLRDFRDSEKYRWAFNCGVLLQFIQNVGISIKYSESFDNTANVLLGRKRDSCVMNGIQINF